MKRVSSVTAIQLVNGHNDFAKFINFLVQYFPEIVPMIVHVILAIFGQQRSVRKV